MKTKLVPLNFHRNEAKNSSVSFWTQAARPKGAPKLQIKTPSTHVWISCQAVSRGWSYVRVCGVRGGLRGGSFYGNVRPPRPLLYSAVRGCLYVLGRKLYFPVKSPETLVDISCERGRWKTKINHWLGETHYSVFPFPKSHRFESD